MSSRRDPRHLPQYFLPIDFSGELVVFDGFVGGLDPALHESATFRRCMTEADEQIGGPAYDRALAAFAFGCGDMTPVAGGSGGAGHGGRPAADAAGPRARLSLVPVERPGHPERPAYRVPPVRRAAAAPAAPCNAGRRARREPGIRQESGDRRVRVRILLQQDLRHRSDRSQLHRRQLRRQRRRGRQVRVRLRDDGQRGRGRHAPAADRQHRARHRHRAHERPRRGLRLGRELQRSGHRRVRRQHLRRLRRDQRELPVPARRQRGDAGDRSRSRLRRADDRRRDAPRRPDDHATTPTAPGASTYGVRLGGGTGRLFVRYDSIQAGKGAAGGNGVDGAVLSPATAPSGNPGVNGASGANAGGTGGPRTDCVEFGGAGGPGGYDAQSGGNGSPGTGATPVGLGGQPNSASLCLGVTGNSTGGGGGPYSVNGAVGPRASAAPRWARLPSACTRPPTAATAPRGSMARAAAAVAAAAAVTTEPCACPIAAAAAAAAVAGASAATSAARGAAAAAASPCSWPRVCITVTDNQLTTLGGGNGGKGGAGTAGQTGGMGGLPGSGADDGGPGGQGGAAPRAARAGPAAAVAAARASASRAAAASVLYMSVSCSTGTPGRGGPGGADPTAATGGTGATGATGENSRSTDGARKSEPPRDSRGLLGERGGSERREAGVTRSHRRPARQGPQLPAHRPRHRGARRDIAASAPCCSNST